MLNIDKIAYSSKINGVDPVAKFFFIAAPLILCIFFDTYITSIFTLFLMSFLTLKFSGVGFKTYLKFASLPFGFLLMGFIAVVVGRFGVDEPILWGITMGSYQYGISLDGLHLGIGLVLRAMGCLSCLYFFSFNTPMAEVFGMMERSGLPKVLIRLGELIYKYIFILLDEAGKVGIAQRSRLGYSSVRSSIACLAMLASSLFVRAYYKGERSFNAMESRCFDVNAGFYDGADFKSGKGFYLGGVCVIIIMRLLWIMMLKTPLV